MLDKSPLAPLGSLRSESLEKTRLSEIGVQNSRGSETPSPARTGGTSHRPLGKLGLGGLGRSFLKTESEESLERRDDSEQNSIRSGGSQKGILKSQHDVILRQAMRERDEKRIMFDLGSNIEFASEVSCKPVSSVSFSNDLNFADG